MLYSQKQFNRDQLLVDLMALRERIGDRDKWVKAWRVGEAVCLVAGCEVVVGLPIGMKRVSETTEDEREIRLGRMIVALFLTLRGPKAHQHSISQPLSYAMRIIIGFNDNPEVTHEALLMLVDRTIAAVTTAAPVLVSAEA